MSNLSIEIDPGSGFCFGVTRAISMAEDELRGKGELYCLGDIVHNTVECERLETLGLKTITHQSFATLSGKRVLLRAHGEPPATYQTAAERHLDLVDATCPVVLQLQRRINQQYNAAPQAQIVIYGKAGHAEVLGLLGQTDGRAIVVESEDDVIRLSPQLPTYLYSQTTMSLPGFHRVVEAIRNRLLPGTPFFWYDTICRQVRERIGGIAAFAGRHDLVLFVCGKKSSNGRVLFAECRKGNAGSLQIEGPADIMPEWLKGVERVGICGATSTPKWLMEQCKERIIEILNQQHHSSCQPI